MKRVFPAQALEAREIGIARNEHCVVAQGERREMRAVQFVDMPWLLQPDHPAVAMYAQSQPKKPLGYDLLRFYALGIDAQRISQQLLTEGEPLRQPMDGVSGRLTRINAHTLMREALPAVYQDDGNAVVLTPP